jgi:hypothetical protein
MFLRKFPLLLALLACLALVACGGDEGDGASSDTDVDALLQKTFTGSKKIDSGKIDLALIVDAKGAQGLNGPVNIKLTGPFQSEGKGKLPKFDIDMSFEGAGQNIRAGLTSTGTKGFVGFNGTEYVVSDPVFAEFKKGFEQASVEGSKNDQSLASLGIDPRKWLKNPRNEGEVKVGDTDTIKITGDVDVPKLLDDVNSALAKAKSLGIQGTDQVPSKLTDEQRKQIQDAVRELDVEIYTGKEDTTLRRMKINLVIQAAAGSGFDSANIDFDLQLLELNEDQEVSEPEGAKPFDELLQTLGPLFGGLGGAGSATPGGSGSSGSGSSGSGSGSSGSAGSDEQLKKYSDCIAAAGSDVEKARQCADLLTG